MQRARAIGDEPAVERLTHVLRDVEKLPDDFEGVSAFGRVDAVDTEVTAMRAAAAADVDQRKQADFWGGEDGGWGSLGRKSGAKR